MARRSSDEEYLDSLLNSVSDSNDDWYMDDSNNESIDDIFDNELEGLDGLGFEDDFEDDFNVDLDDRFSDVSDKQDDGSGNSNISYQNADNLTSDSVIDDYYAENKNQEIDSNEVGETAESDGGFEEIFNMLEDSPEKPQNDQGNVANEGKEINVDLEGGILDALDDISATLEKNEPNINGIDDIDTDDLNKLLIEDSISDLEDIEDKKKKKKRKKKRKKDKKVEQDIEEGIDRIDLDDDVSEKKKDSLVKYFLKRRKKMKI